MAFFKCVNCRETFFGTDHKCPHCGSWFTIKLREDDKPIPDTPDNVHPSYHHSKNVLGGGHESRES